MNRWYNPYDNEHKQLCKTYHFQVDKSLDVRRKHGQIIVSHVQCPQATCEVRHIVVAKVSKLVNHMVSKFRKRRAVEEKGGDGGRRGLGGGGGGRG